MAQQPDTIKNNSAVNALKGTKASYTSITNFTDLDIITSVVTSMESGAFHTGPEVNFTALKIAKHTALPAKRIEMNNSSNTCRWALQLVYENGTLDTFEVNQRYATEDSVLNEVTTSTGEPKHTFLFNRQGKDTLTVDIS